MEWVTFWKTLEERYKATRKSEKENYFKTLPKDAFGPYGADELPFTKHLTTSSIDKILGIFSKAILDGTK